MIGRRKAASFDNLRLSNSFRIMDIKIRMRCASYQPLPEVPPKPPPVKPPPPPPPKLPPCGPELEETGAEVMACWNEFMLRSSRLSMYHVVQPSGP